MSTPSDPRAGGGVNDSLCIALVGSGGAGVMTAGNILLEAAALAGYYALMTRSSGPQIRGGEAAALLRIARRPVECMADAFQVLAAVDWENVQRFAAEIPVDPAGVLIGDPACGAPPEVFTTGGVERLEVPLAALAKGIEHGRANMVLLGVVAEFLGLPETAVTRAVERLLGKRPAAVVASLAAMAAGRRAAHDLRRPGRLATPGTTPAPRWLLSGNEAAGLGALQGGVRFVAAYPITPATELLEWLSPALTEVGGALVQAEDELAAINMALGASFGGVPALTATAGPGLALMMESLGLAVASETPVVVVDVMRVGPSTGIATKSEQGDLNIAINGLHGDAPHLVLAPNGVGDCLATTQWAVELAEALQAPAIVLSDQFLGQARATIDQPALAEAAAVRRVPVGGDGPYRRYALTSDGVSPMAIPGQAGTAYTADGLEHTERGTPSSQAADHLAQLEKRRRKLDLFDYGDRWADIEGAGALAVITFGSTTAPVREALARAAGDGLTLRLVSLRLLAPAQPVRLAAALAGVHRLLVIEQNHSGQLLRYLKSDFDLPCRPDSLRKPGGQQWSPAEIHRRLLEWSEA